MSSCSSIPVPFIQLWVDTSLWSEIYYTDIVKIGSTMGRYSQVKAITFTDKHDSGSSYTWYTMAAVLEYSDHAGNPLQKGTTIMYYSLSSSSMSVVGVYTVDYPAMPRKDITFYNLDSYSQSSQIFKFIAR